MYIPRTALPNLYVVLTKHINIVAEAYPYYYRTTLIVNNNYSAPKILDATALESRVHVTMESDTHMGTPEIAPGGYPPAHARSVHASATSGTAAMPQKLTKAPPFEHF